MSFPLVPSQPFTDFTSRIPASVLNAWRVSLSQAVDGINGGTYTLLSPIVFAGAGIQVTGPLVADDISGHVKTGKTLTVDSGGTFITVSGATFTIGSAATFNGAVDINGATSLDGAVTLTSTMTATSASKVKLLGRKVRRRARVVLSDAPHTIDVSQGDRFILSNSPGAIRSITLDDVSVVPDENECIELLVPGQLASGLKYHVFRADATPIADFYGNAAGDSGIWAEFEYAGGVWRLGANMGGGSTGGVLPLAGA